MTRTCPRCGRDKKPAYAVCWRCWHEDRLEAEYHRGRMDGIMVERSRHGPRNAVQQLDETRWRKLLMLVHPDRHGNSPDANEITRWLLELRPRLGAA